MGFLHKKTLRDVPIHGSRVLLRADYNVPLTESGEIADDFRIVSGLPTLRYLLENSCTVVVCSHLGRPSKPSQKESLEVVASRLQQLLGHPVRFISDCVGDVVKQATKNATKGEVLLLENLRFHPEEEANDEGFAARLATDTNARYFVQDGFGVAHRAHASTDAITRYLPSVSGLLLEKEYESIVGVMQDPARPLTAILGGAKVSDKINVIEKFVDLADNVAVGGAMASAFLKYQGRDIGKSLYESGVEAEIDHIYELAKMKSANVADLIVLPTDVAVSDSLSADARRTVIGSSDVRHDEYILDIGSESIAKIVDLIQKSRTVVWNGTLGVAEHEQFAIGSSTIAAAITQNTQSTSVVGGGDTVDFVLKWSGDGGADFTHVSTGGGASLELMAGGSMPGVEALLDV